jgi:hypothetical protein
MDTKHWSEDVYWIDALDRLYQLRDKGQTQLTLDLTRIEEVAFRKDGPAYKLMDAMCSVRDHEGMEGFRGGTANHAGIAPSFRRAIETSAINTVTPIQSSPVFRFGRTLAWN